MHTIDAAHLADLPDLAVILDREGLAYQKRHRAWFMSASTRKVTTDQLTQVSPLRLIHRR